ncbi:shikimate kinase [Rhodovulum bhavnagarense]|uniref:shikimate kinase n=1 Tax=Rhodovulum bhavnagarense TaxID=992286 RepID=UPI002442D840|nr:shikimate kinase [Rhodovulum bhavnagarense]
MSQDRDWQEVAQLGLRLKKTIALVGLMGAGKTAVGTALARKLNAPFLDSDEEIVKAANMSIAEIFERDGESFFRQKESQVIARLLQGRPAVLSTGGGAFMSETNRREISRNGVAIWLDADLDLLWARVRHKDSRPLLHTADPYATLRNLYNQRRPFYALADLTVKADPRYSVDEMAGAVLAILKTRPDVVEAM